MIYKYCKKTSKKNKIKYLWTCLTDIFENFYNNNKEFLKLSSVIDDSVTLYFKSGLDITSEVVVELLRMDAEAMKK